jgi:hypothetical protein
MDLVFIVGRMIFPGWMIPNGCPTGVSDNLTKPADQIKQEVRILCGNPRPLLLPASAGKTGSFREDNQAI